MPFANVMSNAIRQSFSAACSRPQYSASMSLHIPDHVVHRLGKVLDVMRVEPCHADPSILGHIHMPFVSQLHHLSLVQASEREHANLIRDVLPVARRIELI